MLAEGRVRLETQRESDCGAPLLGRVELTPGNRTEMRFLAFQPEHPEAEVGARRDLSAPEMSVAIDQRSDERPRHFEAPSLERTPVFWRAAPGRGRKRNQDQRNGTQPNHRLSVPPACGFSASRTCQVPSSPKSKHINLAGGAPRPAAIFPRRPASTLTVRRSRRPPARPSRASARGRAEWARRDRRRQSAAIAA